MEVKILKNIMHANEAIADENRRYFVDNNITAVNIMASPGAGKTSLIIELLRMLAPKLNLYVVEGDISSDIDAKKIERLGFPVIQINTCGGCHLDANMIKLATRSLNVQHNSMLFIENVGNLVCPSAFDIGETIKMVIASVPEGHDKPYKYTLMFEAANAVVVNKIDFCELSDFDKKSFVDGVRTVNRNAPIFEVSCKTYAGIDDVANWLFRMHTKK